MDKQLATLLEKVTYWDEYRGDDAVDKREDSLDAVNYRLSNYLERACRRNPRLIGADLPNASKRGLTTASSADKKVCFYCWDTRMGGTMRMYRDVVQYVTMAGPQFKCLFCDTVQIDFGEQFSGIETVKTNDGKTVYLILGYSVGSTKDRGANIDAYVIEGNELKPIDIFQTRTKKLSSIGYGYDMFASSDGKRDIPEIHFSKDNKKLYIPIVDGEVVTDKFLVYVFDGNNYVFDKNAK